MITKEKNLEFLERLIEDTKEGKLEWDSRVNTSDRSFQYMLPDNNMVLLGSNYIGIDYKDSNSWFMTINEELMDKLSDLYVLVYNKIHIEVKGIIDNYLKDGEYFKEEDNYLKG